MSPTLPVGVIGGSDPKTKLSITLCWAVFIYFLCATGLASSSAHSVSPIYIMEPILIIP